jgi:sugar (pentulose or hexulose) kinase
MYLAFDVGTTSVKTALFDRLGRLLAKAIKNYSLATPQVDWYEVDPEVYWRAVMEGFGETLRAARVDPKAIRAISGCSQGETVIFLDPQDRPVRPAIVWLDNRPRQEVEELKRSITAEEFYRTTGCLDIEPTWSVLKTLWLRDNEPASFKKTAKIMLVEDYIVYLLTGRFCSTPTLLHSTGFLDIHKRRYWAKTSGYAGVEKLLPEIVEVGSVVGRLKSDLADGLGLSREVVVVKGAMDQTLSNIGSGNIHSGIVTETTGTALAIGVTADSVEGIHANRLPYQPHALPGKFLILPYAQTSGIIYKWFRDAFGQEEIRNSGDPEKAYEGLNALAASVPAGSDGLVLLPFFAGASAPENDMFAKGVWYGITLKHGKAHFARAIQEAVGFMLRKILALIQGAGIPIEEVRCMGGAARSDLWLRIKADICNLPMVRMREEETSTLGCALMAAVAVGEYRDVEEASRAMVHLGGRFEPQARNAALYDRQYALYKELYETLKPVFRKYSGG